MSCRGIGDTELIGNTNTSQLLDRVSINKSDKKLWDMLLNIDADCLTTTVLSKVLL